MEPKTTEVTPSPGEIERGVQGVPELQSKHDFTQNETAQDSNDADGAWDPAFLVIFQDGDPQNPLNWSTLLKWGITAAVSGTGFIRIMVSTMMAPAIETIAAELHMTPTESNMALSVYLLATAFGPLIIGPLSEIYGRKSIFHFTNIWFLVFNFVCGFAHSKGVLIACRLLAGFGASAAYSLAYGVLGDVWSKEQRGKSLSLYLLIPLTGSAVGPIITGFIVQYSTWRWMFWATTIMQVVFELCSLIVFYESYAPVLLRRIAIKKRAETGDSRYHAAIERFEHGRSAAWKLRHSLSRPLRLLAFDPVIQVRSILSGLNYGLLYFALASFSALYVSAYNESVSTSSLHYIAICTGTISGSQLCGPLLDYVYKKMTARAGGNSNPEMRIPLLIPGALFTPLGFFLYGWAAQYHLFWLVIDVGAALLALGMQIFDVTLSAYTMDAYPEHVSSAEAAGQVLRSLLAFAFPLFSNNLYEALGYGWGNSLLAFLSIGITLPATAILWYYGARLRARYQST